MNYQDLSVIGKRFPQADGLPKVKERGKGVCRDEMEQYLRHHLAIAGAKQNPFEDPAIAAIH